MYCPHRDGSGILEVVYSMVLNTVKGRVEEILSEFRTSPVLWRQFRDTAPSRMYIVKVLAIKRAIANGRHEIQRAVGIIKSWCGSSCNRSLVSTSQQVPSDWISLSVSAKSISLDSTFKSAKPAAKIHAVLQNMTQIMPATPYYFFWRHQDSFVTVFLYRNLRAKRAVINS